MNSKRLCLSILLSALLLVASVVHADKLNCSLSEYKASSGLTAQVVGDTLLLTWDGEQKEELRLQLTIVGGTPTIRDLAARSKGGQWISLATNVIPEFRVVSGVRRMTQQQLQPLGELGIPITPDRQPGQVGSVLGCAPACSGKCADRVVSCTPGEAICQPARSAA